jgi:8-oxoguanine deaminase
MARILIKNALVVLTLDTVGEIKSGDVLVDGPAIAQVGKNLTAPADEIIDATGKLVTPGFINTHHHLFQVLTRSLKAVQDAKLFDWLTYLYEIWKHLTVHDLYTAALAGLGELLLTGCTTSADHHYLVPKGLEGDLFAAEAQAAQELGIRLHLSRGSMSLGRSSGGLPPESVIQDEDEILTDCARVIAAFHDPRPFSLCQVSLAPCSPFSVTPSLMRSVAELARQHKVRLHTHLAETIDEQQFCQERFGKRPVAYADELGWLGPDVWIAHAVCLNAAEIDVLQKTQTGVAHCPTSNLRLGSGIAPIPAMLEAGVPVGLAVDGSASNDSSNMLRELQISLLIHRVGTGVCAMPVRRVYQMACTGGAQVLGRGDLGIIRPGMAADLALFDMTGLAYAGALDDPAAALLLCGVDQRADTVLVNGRIVVRDKHLIRMDEMKIAEQARRASARLLSAVSA